MAGFLIPDHYKVIPPTENEFAVASIVWGFSLAAGLFSGVECFRQTRRSWTRSRRANPYVIMIWAEWLTSMAMGVISWFFIRGSIAPSFWVYFFLLCLWVVQIQCICGIIINRIALLMVDRRRVSNIKWSVAIILGIVNISVFCIWIPARLQISETFVHVNEIWDRIEKGIFLAVDAGLNFYFIHLVRTKLVSNGLTKYNALFKFNMVMVAISISLDVILIGSMSIANGFIYVQFHPLVYILKLHIEMSIADLIVKVVQATTEATYYRKSATGTEMRSTRSHAVFEHSDCEPKTGANGQALDPFSGHRSEVAATSDGHHHRISGGGITKIVHTRVTSTLREQDLHGDDDSESSTHHLNFNG